MQPLNPNVMPPAQMPTAMFPGSIPMEPNSGFSHDGRMLAQPMMSTTPNMQPPAPMPQDMPWQGAVQVNQAQPMPLPPTAPALEPMDSQIQQRIKLNHAIKADQTFELDEKLWALAKSISSSVFVPACIRSTQVSDHTGDVYLLMLRARSLGLSAAQAFSELFVITNQKTGDAKIGMYVRTKAAICAAYGEWSVDILPDGSAVAKGKRYSNGQVKEVVYSVNTALARGMVSIDKQGRLIGVGKWADKLEDMMRTRALGRLLDALFPDVISGVVSMDELNDDDYERSLRQSLEPLPTAAQTAQQDVSSPQVQVAEDKAAESVSAPDGDISLAAAVSKTRRAKRSTKTTPSEVIEAAPAPQELTPPPVPPAGGLLSPIAPQPEAVPEPNPFAAPNIN